MGEIKKNMAERKRCTMRKIKAIQMERNELAETLKCVTNYGKVIGANIEKNDEEWENLLNFVIDIEGVLEKDGVTKLLCEQFGVSGFLDTIFNYDTGIVMFIYDSKDVKD